MCTGSLASTANQLSDNGFPQYFIEKKSNKMDNKFDLLIFFTVFLFCIVSCRQSAFEEKSNAGKAFVKGNYKIIFSLPGDDFASAADLEQLQTIKEIIVKQGVGKPVSTGSGMGNMVLVVNVNREETLRAIKGIIHDNYPSAKYKIVHEQPF
jgi:hypothetical protein